jgi:hypothetical protein
MTTVSLWGHGGMAIAYHGAAASCCTGDSDPFLPLSQSQPLCVVWVEASPSLHTHRFLIFSIGLRFPLWHRREERETGRCMIEREKPGLC